MTDSSGCKLSELLPTDLGEVTQTLREELGKNIDRPEPGLLPFLGAQAADALGGILDVDVFEVLARGWVTARELQELADDERYPPDEDGDGHARETRIHHQRTSDAHVRIRGPSGANSGLHLRAQGRDQVGAIASTCAAPARLGRRRRTVSAQLKYGAVKLHREMKSRAVPLSGWLSLRGEGFEIVRARDD